MHALGTISINILWNSTSEPKVICAVTFYWNPSKFSSIPRVGVVCKWLDIDLLFPYWLRHNKEIRLLRVSEANLWFVNINVHRAIEVLEALCFLTMILAEYTLKETPYLHHDRGSTCEYLIFVLSKQLLSIAKHRLKSTAFVLIFLCIHRLLGPGCFFDLL